MTQILGRSQEELIGKQLVEYVHPSHLKEFQVPFVLSLFYILILILHPAIPGVLIREACGRCLMFACDREVSEDAYANKYVQAYSVKV